MTLAEPSILSSTSQFQAEPVEGRRVSKVVKTTVVHGERMEKSLGDSSLATDLPSAKDDFEEVQSLVSFCVYFPSMCTLWLLCVWKEKRLSLCHFMPRLMEGVRIIPEARFPP